MLPSGFIYRAGFLTRAEERALLDEIARLEFSAVRMRGVTARRRVIHYGWTYGYESWRLTEGPPLPEFLDPLRERAAGLVGLEADALAEALITEYPPGATIGWHRDAPAFGDVVAASLGGACRLRFRRGDGEAREVREITVEPRSAYVLSGEARSAWQHAIPPVRELRYSISFRTLKKGRAGGASSTTLTP